MIRYLACLAFSLLAFLAHTQPLFKISQNQKFGFINSTGKIIIKPIYVATGEFSEGLCPVRKGPYYGYINNKGKLVIAPKFDYASNFSEGKAPVFIDGKQYFIDTKGKIHYYTTTKKGNYIYVYTTTGRKGVMNSYGRLIVDTLYKGRIDEKHGYFLLSDSAQTGVMDSTGKWYLDPQSNYNEFHKDFPGSLFYNDLLINPELRHKNITLAAFASNIRFKYNGEPLQIINDTLAIVRYSYYDRFHKNTHNYFKRFGFYFSNEKGQIFLDDEHFYVGINDRSTGGFGKNDRSYFAIRDSAEKTYYFDSDLNPISKREFYLKRSIIKEYASFCYDDSSFIYDKNYQITFATPYRNAIEKFDTSTHLFFMRDFSDYTDSFPEDWNYQYGIINYKGEWLSKPFVNEVNDITIQNGLIYCVHDTTEAYYNMKGEKIYEGEFFNPYRIKSVLDIDYIDAAYFRYTEYKKRIKESIANKKSISYERTINQNADSVRTAIIEHNKGLDKNAFTFTISTDYKKASLMCNASFDPLCFMIDDCLDIYLEAQDKYGKWHNITFPYTDCGLSFHFGSICPGKVFEAEEIPQFKGGIKTKMRLALHIYPTEKHYPTANYYSKTFTGYINPAQLWRYQD